MAIKETYVINEPVPVADFNIVASTVNDVNENGLPQKLFFTGTDHEGLVVISLTTTQRDLLTPSTGAIIYNTTTAQLESYNGSSWSAIGGAAGGGASFVWKEKFNGSVGTGLIGYMVVPDDLDGKDIKEIRAGVLGLPGTQSLNIDIRKNGTATTDSVLTSDVPLSMGIAQAATNGVFQIGCNTVGSTVGTAGTTLDAARTTLATDDILYIYNTQVGSGPAGADETVEVIIA